MLCLKMWYVFIDSKINNNKVYYYYLIFVFHQCAWHFTEAMT